MDNKLLTVDEVLHLMECGFNAVIEDGNVTAFIYEESK